MKRVHPDLSGQAGTEAEARAKRINEAFAILKDPAKRALYDSELERNDGADRSTPARAARPPPPAAPVPAQTDPRRPASRRGAVRGLLLVLMLAAPVFGGAWYYREKLRNAPLLRDVEAGASASAAAVEAAPYERPIVEADIVDAIADAQWVLDYGTTEDAVEYSRGCFDELRTYPTIRLLDRCIAFDFAWQYQLKAPVSGYFAAPAMKARHLGTADSFADGEEMNEARLESLEALTVATLARLVEGSGDGG